MGNLNKKIDLLIIDPQNDFAKQGGSLYVEGADKDMERLSGFIDRVGDKLNDIHITLDSHHLFDIAHPVFWVESNGKNPMPFTIISHSDITSGKWRPKHSNILLDKDYTLLDHVKDYTKALEDNGRYPLCIWPPHCLIGSKGQCVVDCVYESVTNWERTKGIVNYVTKGSNFLVEHYSAVKAEVEDPNDGATGMNMLFAELPSKVDKIIIAGEASSHCVKNTVLDIFNEINEDLIKKFVFLEDCSSPVTGFESEAEDFKEILRDKGVEITTTDKYMV